MEQEFAQLAGLVSSAERTKINFRGIENPEINRKPSSPPRVLAQASKLASSSLLYEIPTMEPAKKRLLEDSTSTRSRIQLLLHCVDGCVPYLNPNQLEKHFPPSKSNLWLGIAVGDSCVAPIIATPAEMGTEGKEECNKKSERIIKKKFVVSRLNLSAQIHG